MHKAGVELDHIFLFVSGEKRARQMMKEAELRASFSRVHKGQGTQNLCAFLDDIFLELLWLDSTEMADASRDIGLGDRGCGEGSSIGISWRGNCDLESVLYKAPFLPEGMSIPVARASLDRWVPMTFESPGGQKPIDRDPDIVGERQSPNLAGLGHCEIVVPNPVDVSALLAGFDQISVQEGPEALNIQLLDYDGNVGRRFCWTSDLKSSIS